MAAGYQSKFTGKQIDKAIGRIPTEDPTVDSLIVVNASGTSVYKPIISLGSQNIKDGAPTGSLKQLKDSDFTLANPNSGRDGLTITSDVVGQYATALGGKSRAEGKRSFSAGTQTIAIGNYSAAFGNNSVSQGSNSFVSGMQNSATGTASYSEGSNNLSYANSTHTEGIGNKAYGEGSHIEGYGNIESQTGNQNNHIEGSNNTTYAYTKMAHIEGGDNKAGKNFAHAEGRYTDANGNYTHTEGIYSKSLSTIPTGGSTGSGSGSGTGGAGTGGSFDLDANAGSCVHAEGDRTIGIGYGSHAEGYSTQAEGHFSHAEGVLTKTKGLSSQGAHAEGYENTTSGVGSHVGGRGSTIINGEATIVHGYNNNATGSYNSVFGSNNTVNGVNITAIGTNNNITSDSVHAFGAHLVKVGSNTGHGQVVLGRNNKDETIYDTSGGVAPVLVVGAGIPGQEYNAFVIDSNGQVIATQQPTKENSVIRKKELDALSTKALEIQIDSSLL